MKFSRAGRKSESGASAVEFALIAPLLVFLTIGLIELGIFMWNLSRTQSSVAASIRTAGTLSRVDGYEDQVADALKATAVSSNAQPVSLVVYRADPATGRPATLSAGITDYSNCTSDCFIFYWNSTTKNWTKSTSPTWDASQQKACGPSAETDFVGVWMKSNYKPITGYGIKSSFVTRGIARLEPVPLSTGQQCKP